jgi:pimeloyl-ACP methyl ester carboxylesterase
MKIRSLIIIGLSILIILAGWLMFKSFNIRVRIPEGAQVDKVFLTPCSVKVDGKKYNADCGTLVVSEHRGDTDANLIALPVKRIHSTSSSPAEPIFYLEGGPGSSNMHFAPPSWLLKNHDFVMIGYRGVDGSPKLDCREISKAIKGVNGDLLSQQSLDNLGAAIRTCAVRLEESGVNLQGYTITEVVEDMESARRLLGYEKINLLSQSYGTRVAQIYAYKYPQSLLRSAMVGVNPPGHFVWSPEFVDSQVMYYADLWRQQSGSSAPDLVAAMQSVNTDMPDHWFFLPIDPGKVKSVAFAMLYHRTTAPMIFDAYLSAAKGDASGLALMSAAYDLIMPNMSVWGEFFAIGSSADYETGRDYRTEMDPPNAVLGSPMSLLIWGSAPGNWPPYVIADEYRQVSPTDVETLLINGSVDFSTPAQFAEEELLPSLNNGQCITIAEQGHVSDFWAFQPEARQLLLTSFYDTGKADDSLYQYLPMDFTPKMRFPVIAKILIAFSAIVLIGLLFLIWSLFRRKNGKVHKSN